MASASKAIKTRCITGVKLNDDIFKPSDPITLDKETYESLVATGAVKSVDVEDLDDNEELTRAQELEELTVPALQKMAEDLEIDPVPKRKAEIIDAIIQAEEAKAAGN